MKLISIAGTILVLLHGNTLGVLPSPSNQLKSKSVERKLSAEGKSQKITAAPAPANTASLSDFDQCLMDLQSQSLTEEQFLDANRTRLESLVGSWFFDENANRNQNPGERSTAGKFFQALAHSGVYDSRRSLPEDSVLAELLFKEVIQEDPDNSAPILFLAELYHHQHRGDEELDTLMRLEQTKYFNSYSKDFARLLFSSVKEAKDLLPAITIWTRSPYPSISGIHDIMKTSNLTRVARQMVEDGNLAKERVDGIDWIPVEYAIGYSVLKLDGKSQGLYEPAALIRSGGDLAGRYHMAVSDAGTRRCNIDILNHPQALGALKKVLGIND